MRKGNTVHYSFAFKLSLYITTSIIIIFLFVLSYNYYITRKTILEDIESYMRVMASSAINKVENGLAAAQQIPKDLAYVFEYTVPTTEEVDSLLKSIVKDNEQIYGCLIAFEPYAVDAHKYYFAPYFYERPKDTVNYADIGSEEYNYFKKEWYTFPKKSGKGVWVEPYFEEEIGVDMVAYSQPFYKKINGKRIFWGVVVCEISIDRLMEYVSDIKFLNAGYAFLISNKGTFLSYKNKNFVLKESIFSIAEKYNNPSYKEVGERMIKKETGVSQYYSSYLKTECLISYTPLETTGWSLGIVVPKEEIFSELDSITLKLFLMGLLGYFLSLIFVIILAKKMTGPLNKLAKATYEIGVGNFNVKLPSISTFDEIGVLSRAFRSMQDSLIKYIANLQETTAAKERMEKELVIAHEIQRSIIPRNFPKVKQFDMYAMLTPAREIGGDMYDFFFIDEKYMCFAIADVSGKGVPAALFMAIARTLLRAKLNSSKNLTIAINSLNEDLCKENDCQMFLTLFVGILNIATGELEFCNAGHCKPAIYTRNKGFLYLNTEKTFIAIGIMPVNYVTNKIELTPGNILFLYTDGVTEAMNSAYEEFTEERLLKLLIKNQDANVESIVDNVKLAVQEHELSVEQSDDITMVAIKYKG